MHDQAYPAIMQAFIPLAKGLEHQTRAQESPQYLFRFFPHYSVETDESFYKLSRSINYLSIWLVIQIFCQFNIFISQLTIWTVYMKFNSDHFSFQAQNSSFFFIFIIRRGFLLIWRVEVSFFTRFDMYSSDFKYQSMFTWI